MSAYRLLILVTTFSSAILLGCHPRPKTVAVERGHIRWLFLPTELSRAELSRRDAREFAKLMPEVIRRRFIEEYDRLYPFVQVTLVLDDGTTAVARLDRDMESYLTRGASFYVGEALRTRLMRFYPAAATKPAPAEAKIGSQ